LTSACRPCLPSVRPSKWTLPLCANMHCPIPRLQHFFASFVFRDEAFLLLKKLHEICVNLVRPRPSSVSCLRPLQNSSSQCVVLLADQSCASRLIVAFATLLSSLQPGHDRRGRVMVPPGGMGKRYEGPVAPVDTVSDYSSHDSPTQPSGAELTEPTPNPSPATPLPSPEKKVTSVSETRAVQPAPATPGVDNAGPSTAPASSPGESSEPSTPARGQSPTRTSHSSTPRVRSPSEPDRPKPALPPLADILKEVLCCPAQRALHFAVFTPSDV
jgi:hypothetical protein